MLDVRFTFISQELPCMYLPYHELESVCIFVTVIIVIITIITLGS